MDCDAGSQYTIPGTVVFLWPVGPVSCQYSTRGGLKHLPAVDCLDSLNATILLTIIALTKIVKIRAQ
jgi:hypothetical protein